MVRSQRLAGFTLVEVMTVVVIMSLVIAVAAYGVRNARGTKTSGFARSLLSMVHEARQTAISLGRPTRIRLVPGYPTASVVSQAVDPQQPGAWRTVAGPLRAPLDVELCAPDAFAKVTPGAPACPLAQPINICFSASSRVSVSDNGACPGGAPTLGATLYARSFDGANRHKIMIWGLTGLPRPSDQW